MSSYTAQVGPKNAKHLEELLPDTITDMGGGSISIADAEALRDLATGEDGSLLDAEDGLSIWAGGDTFPMFNDSAAAVADALGAQTHYKLAKQEFEHQRDLFAAALRELVASTGSVESAAEEMGVPVSELTEALDAVDDPGITDIVGAPTLPDPAPEASAPADDPAAGEVGASGVPGGGTAGE